MDKVFILVKQEEFFSDILGVYSDYEKALEACFDQIDPGRRHIRRDILVKGIDGESEEDFYYLEVDAVGNVVEEDEVSGDVRVVEAVEFDPYITEVVSVKVLGDDRDDCLERAEKFLAAAEQIIRSE